MLRVNLADLITSGVVPGVVMYQLFLEIGIREVSYNFFIFQNEFTFSFAPFALVGFLISLGAAIRLSKFNIDIEQRYEFKGLPAPANALFIVALPLLMAHPLFAFFKPFLSTYPALVLISILSAILMNIRLPLFSFKIQSFELRDYGFQLLLILLSVPTFYFLQWVAVPVMIVIYLFLNVLKNSFD